jgi:hypothetical protein
MSTRDTFIFRGEISNMAFYKKILRYWTTNPEHPQLRANMKAMDVTNYRCEEDVDSLQIIDGCDRIVAEFGPGREHDRWMLTVEYPTTREQLSTLSLSLLKKLDRPLVPVAPAAPKMNVPPAAVPETAATVETGFIMASRSGRR